VAVQLGGISSSKQGRKAVETFVNILGWIWRLAVNVIQLILVVVVFSTLRGRFEVTVVSIPGFIYVTIRTVGFGIWMAFVGLANGIEREVVRLRDLLNDPLAEWEVEGKAAALKIAKRTESKLYVDMAFLGIVWLVCLYQLLAAPSN
jgi:hypothetical protein